jgi:restriction system protein
VAAQAPYVSGQPADIAKTVHSSVMIGFAHVGKMVLPVIFVAAAGVSAFQRGRQKDLLVDGADAIDQMNWRDFERLVAEAFRLQGYQVLETGGGGADGGVDMVLSKPKQNGREKVLVQCKHWRAQRVGVDVVRELYGVMAARGAAGGIVVTSGRFTDEAHTFAEGRNVSLINGAELQKMIRRAQAALGKNASPEAAATPKPAPTPRCPSCDKPMVERVAKRGPNPGERFWGCSDYPACKGTKRIA